MTTDAVRPATLAAQETQVVGETDHALEAAHAFAHGAVDAVWRLGDAVQDAAAQVMAAGTVLEAEQARMDLGRRVRGMLEGLAVYA